jgi:DNA ligase (NAD+)
MRAELGNLERERGVRVTLDSPSLREGGPPRTAFERAQHAPPWPEPQIVRSPSELRRHVDFLTAAEGQAPVCVGTAWMTGVEVALTYADGILRRAVLRGDGFAGEDVTDNVRTIGSAPLRLRPPGSITESRVSHLTRLALGPSTTTPVPPFPSELCVRALVTMRTVDVHALDRGRIDAGEAPYVSPSAAILGSLRRLDPKVTAGRRLKLFAYDAADVPPGVDTAWQLLGALKSWGFNVTSLSWRCVGYEEILDFVNALQQEKPRFTFPLSGGLLKSNRLGPDGTVFLHFANFGKRARAQSVYRAVGRTGAVLPVALIVREGQQAPDGVPIPAASATEMLDVREGATVRALAGGVAPVLEVERHAEEAPPSPRAAEPCPACSAALVRPPDEPFSHCANKACRGRLRSQLLHLIGPRGLALRSLNARNAEALLAGTGASLPDLYALDPERVEKLAPGTGEAFRAEIQQATRLPLWRMLYLSSIPFVGERAARLVASQVLDASGLLVLRPDAARSIAGLEPEAAAGLSGWLSSDARAVVDRLRGLGVELVGEEESFAAPFAGRRIVVAGKLETLTADRAVDEIERRGGMIDLRVSRTTDLLITGKEAQEAVEAAGAYKAVVVEESTLVGLLRLTIAV